MSKHPTPERNRLWDGGWYRFARRLESPNFGPRPADAVVDLLLIHSISLPPGQYGGDEVQRLFTNTLDWNAHPYFKSIEGMQVSSHFYIRRNGELWQFVSCNERAWHAGVSCYRGRDNCNDDSVGIELEGLEGESFEAGQYETLGSLCAALGQRYPVQHIAGHEHVAPGRKADPGPGFQWAVLQQSLGWPSRYFPEEPA
ncbi:1,6-anhydro-N-acetylmuramyl-L-alanine amidase AmpD [Curvibacter sp. PAE-UM]|uniref:1,6-anhydro-N-acetylmuramyl-L-alanine amidase AmpD n=1 Tax=Curvibacter sp. PAE-UM TaxID=1714344 RepID=UPI00071094E3|nr:1,6-anhydro-N-acetylmuramyl-L-alanine amidase AmpD [Curvibacter sp. PAE-UM]KRI01655.1 anhydro-N-acetylmuramyl-tripeptide amidase [Curvibacter sp. PAE-UM]